MQHRGRGVTEDARVVNVDGGRLDSSAVLREHVRLLRRGVNTAPEAHHCAVAEVLFELGVGYSQGREMLVGPKGCACHETIGLHVDSALSRTSFSPVENSPPGLFPRHAGFWPYHLFAGLVHVCLRCEASKREQAQQTRIKASGPD